MAPWGTEHEDTEKRRTSVAETTAAGFTNKNESIGETKKKKPKKINKMGVFFIYFLSSNT
jgi:hypothetical protein